MSEISEANYALPFITLKLSVFLPGSDQWEELGRCLVGLASRTLAARKVSHLSAGVAQSSFIHELYIVLINFSCASRFAPGSSHWVYYNSKSLVAKWTPLSLHKIKNENESTAVTVKIHAMVKLNSWPACLGPWSRKKFIASAHVQE